MFREWSLADAMLLEDLQKHPGYPVLLAMLNEKLMYYRAKLESCSKDELLEYQTYVKAYNSIETGFEHIITEGRNSEL